MRTLSREIDGLDLPAVEKISQRQQDDPFQVLDRIGVGGLMVEAVAKGRDPRTPNSLNTHPTKHEETKRCPRSRAKKLKT